jgi:chromosomal replication initiation ATPase DnaA
MNHLYEKGMNKSDIGRAFEKDHATVINGVKTIQRIIRN